MGISRRTLIVSGLAVSTLGVAGAIGAANGAFRPGPPDADQASPGNHAGVGGAPAIFPDSSNVWGFGSSTMALLGPHLGDKFAGATFHAQGKGGERAQHVFARMGSTPALVSVKGNVIPASGSVAVRAWNMPASRSLKAFPGSLAGVRGILSSTESQVLFTRSEPGVAYPMPGGTRFIPDSSAAVQQSVVLINAGKNNLRDAGDPVGLVNSLTNGAYEWMAPRIKRCVVMTHFVNTDQTPGSQQFANVRDVNANILATYEQVAFDLNAYVLSEEIWAESGIRPSAADLRQQQLGIKPAALSRDVGHLNDAANAAVASRIRTHFIALGYFPAAPG